MATRRLTSAFDILSFLALGAVVAIAALAVANLVISLAVNLHWFDL